MKNVFPPEIINVSVESHFSRFNKKSKLLYVVVLLFFAGTVMSLFLIKTEITVQSRGVFRSSSESIELISPVVAKVVKSNLDENQSVSRGDTLIWLDCKKQSERIVDNRNSACRNAPNRTRLYHRFGYHASNWVAFGQGIIPTG